MTRDGRARIAAYLDATTPAPAWADLVFIPGTRLSNPAVIAAQLLRDGRAPLVLVTGGVNRQNGLVEAHGLRDLLLEAGVAGEQIMVEDSSTNTRDNAAHGWAIACARLERPPASVVAVCKWMHSRRVLMTLKAQFPPGITYYAVTYAPLGLTRQAWVAGAEAPQGAEVMPNWRNIPAYLAKGDLAEIEASPDGGWN